MINIQYASDLHLEINDFCPEMLIPAVDTLVLAGDVMCFHMINSPAGSGFLDYLSDNFKTTYWIPGNHEYYGSHISHRSGSFAENVRENVVLLNNTSVDIGGIKFVFSTFWSHVHVHNEWGVYRMVRDFRRIGGLGIGEFNEMHRQSVAFVEAEAASAPSVVVTHHCPTYMQYPRAYLGDSLNDAFVSEQFDLIGRAAPLAWIYGHHHTNTEEFSVFGTRMLTNQLGRGHEGRGYDPSKILSFHDI